LTLINQIFSGRLDKLNVAVYVDDILIASPNFEDHLRNLDETLCLLRENRLTCNPNKTDIVMPKIDFLGHELSANGIRMSEKKVKAIKAIQPPKSLKGVQRVYGMINYWRPFIPDFNKWTSNMRNLLLKDTKFYWSEACQIELDHLKECLISRPILQPIDTQKDLTIMTDASSKHGLGWVYMQPDDSNQLKVVSYGTQSLTPGQKNYSALELELMSLIAALKCYDYFCVHKNIYVWTDNVKVLQLSSWHPCNARQRRWLAYLMQFRLVMKYVPGKHNYTADCLSRIFQDMTSDQIVQFHPDYADKTDFIVSVDVPAECHESVSEQSLSANVPPNVPPQEPERYPLRTDSTNTSRSAAMAPTVPDSTREPQQQYTHAATADADKNDNSVHNCYKLTILRDNNNDNECDVDGQCGMLNVYAPEFSPDINALTRRQAQLLDSINKQNTDTQPTVDIPSTDGNDIQTPQLGVQEHTATDEIQGEGTQGLDVVSHALSQSQSHESPEGVDGRPDCPSPVIDNDMSIPVSEPTADATVLPQNADCSGDLLILPTVRAEDYWNDNDFSHLYKYLTTGELTGDNSIDRTTLIICDQYYIRAGLLYRLRIPRGKKQSLVRDLANCLCVPVKFRYQLIAHVHNQYGHFGVKRNFLTLSPRVFWKGLYTDLESFTKTCEICQRGKRYFQKQTVPLHPLPVLSTVGEVFHLDHKNLPRRTKEGNIAILSMVESYSGWICLEPVPDLTAETTARVFVRRVITNFGIPAVVYTDKGTAFCSKFFQTIARILGIKHRTSAALLSRSNGLAEQAIARFNQMVKLYVDSDKDIENALPNLELALRSTAHTQLGISAFEIVQGRQANLGSPIPFEVDERFPDDQKAYQKYLQENLTKIRAGVKTLRGMSKEEDSAQYNKKHHAKEPNWHVGQAVLLKDGRIKPHSDVVVTHKPYSSTVYYIADIVQGPGIGVAYKLIDANSGVSMRRLVTSDRLRPLDNDRELLKSRLPPLYDKDAGVPSATNEHEAVSRSKQTTNERDKAGKTSDCNNWYPAIRVVQQKKSGNSVRYKVLFEDGTYDWYKQISPLLL